VLALLAEAELTVSDLTDILRQSQPRISRHLKLLAEAGLVERFREGTWAFFRLSEQGNGAEVARALIDRLDPADQIIVRDRQRLTSVRQARAASAQAYFRAHAAEWDRIRKLHVADAEDRAMVVGPLAAAQQGSSLPSVNGLAPRVIQPPIEGESPPTSWRRTTRPINR
jgi:DNA-binding transcriptional ArsR family regulator